MKYLGTDFRHNLRERYFLKEFAGNGCSCYALVSKNDKNELIIAIPRYYIYHYTDCNDTPYLCDLFKYDKGFPYSIKDNTLFFDDEENVKMSFLEFVSGIQAMQRHLADTILLSNRENLLNIKRREQYQPDNEPSYQECINVINVTSYFDTTTKEYVLQNAYGERLMSFKYFESIKDFKK